MHISIENWSSNLSGNWIGFFQFSLYTFTDTSVDSMVMVPKHQDKEGNEKACKRVVSWRNNNLKWPFNFFWLKWSINYLNNDREITGSWCWWVLRFQNRIKILLAFDSINFQVGIIGKQLLAFISHHRMELIWVNK